MRIVLLLGLLFLSLNATSVKRDLIINGYISKNQQEYKNDDSFNLRKELFKDSSVKMLINKNMLQNKTFYAKITCDVENIVYSNVEYEQNFDTIILKFDKNTPEEVIFKFSYEEESLLSFRVFILNEFEYKYIVKNEQIIFGIAYGIIFCAFLYNFVIFLYSRQKSFLYYSLMQLFLMATLAYITVLVSQTFITVAQQIFIDFLETSCILLTILFSKEILNTRKYMKGINKILNFLIYINVVDLISIFIFEYSLLYDYLPRSLVISVLVLSGLIAVFKGQRVAIFYFLGWLVIFIILVIAERDLVGIDELYIIHLGLPIESLVLSFALGYKLKLTVDEKKEKERMLIHQSKLASMGEMINNIAHQWRQPLAHLSFINMNLEVANEDKDLTSKYLQEKLEESNGQINFMSQTIDNFRDFYKPKKELEFFYVSSAVQKAIDIIKPSLDFLQIDIDFKIKKDKRIKAYENEYSQVILNLLTNAKDALSSKNIEKAKIKVLLYGSKNKSILCVDDNAGGIEKHNMEKIFDPYFTTKDKSSGIGLYMSKVIVESHLKGEIRVINRSNGASFSVEV